jgi:arsenate reductase
MTAARRAGDAPGADARPPIRVIFICTGNSARSQIAEALLRRDGGGDFEVVSAGVEPHGVHPLTIRVLGEVGIDISGARSKPVSEYLGQPFDYVVTVCDRARESCPVFPGGAQTLHWGFDDPAEAEGSEAERLAVFRRVMAEISGRIRAFVPLATSAARSGPARAG